MSHNVVDLSMKSVDQTVVKELCGFSRVRDLLQLWTQTQLPHFCQVLPLDFQPTFDEGLVISQNFGARAYIFLNIIVIELSIGTCTIE